MLAQRTRQCLAELRDVAHLHTDGAHGEGEGRAGTGLLARHKAQTFLGATCHTM